MIIYQNGFMSLDYNPSTDILNVELPNVMEIGVAELKRSLEIVAENIQNYHIKRLLLDSSRVLVDQIEDEEYKGIVGQFLANLMKTRLERIARVNSSRLAHEKRVLQVTAEATQKLGTSITVKTFTGKPEALSWLLVQENS
ncbi:hypothetical protein FVR03_20295 [Pontibacter qinzhouensis]|uniref:STAS/SEC14 domain-containing protein n=1 Tax=Pontibacter qinzhouensis TaxID=2603253 RepID=A0A5C8J4K2_9BACT|nr:hypothetical protein [Pontibacter qinzhouensis]TXK29863.1 hypothetical protein FVR03_20295 [Pontibacter qinzhouensis]